MASAKPSHERSGPPVLPAGLGDRTTVGRLRGQAGGPWRGPGQGRVSLARAAGQRIERDRRTQLLEHRPDRQLPGHRPRRVVRLDLPVELLRVRSVDLRPVVPALGVPSPQLA